MVSLNLSFNHPIFAWIPFGCLHPSLCFKLIQAHTRGLEWILQGSFIQAQLSLFSGACHALRLLDVRGIHATHANIRRCIMLHLVLGRQVPILQLLPNTTNVYWRNGKKEHVFTRLLGNLTSWDESVDDGVRGDLRGRTTFWSAIPRCCKERHSGIHLPGEISQKASVSIGSDSRYLCCLDALVKSVLDLPQTSL